MSQNIYDNPEFFEGYSQFDRSVNGLAGAPEWPCLQTFLPSSLTGMRVLDLGCGFGSFTRWARHQGASSVHGIDISETMLARARALTTAKDQAGVERGRSMGSITFTRADLDTLELPVQDGVTYDLVFSSLTLHYLQHLPALVATVHRVLRPGCDFVFSIEHPIFTASSTPGMATNPETGRRYWRLDDYQVEGERVTEWFVKGVQKQHRTLTTYINLLLETGFELTGFEEWKPTKEELEANAENPIWGDEIARPLFLLMRARKK